MRKLALLVIPTLAFVGLATPAEASSADVHLDVDLFGAIVEADCDVTATDSALDRNQAVDAIDVLRAAEDIGCIDGFQTKDFGEPFNEFVICIDDTCGSDGNPENAGFFWAFYVNCQPSSQGASNVELSHDDVVEFSYEPIATLGMLPLACLSDAVGT